MKRNTMGWALAGLAVGAVAGILAAPDSGRNTRRRLRHRTERAKSRTAEELDHAKVLVTTKVDEIKEKGNEAWEGTKGTVGRTVNTAADQAKTRVSEVKENAGRSLHAVRRGLEEGRMAYRDAIDDAKSDEQPVHQGLQRAES